MLSEAKHPQLFQMERKCRFFAEFSLSGNCRFFALLRMTSEGLRMTCFTFFGNTALAMKWHNQDKSVPVVG